MSKSQGRPATRDHLLSGKKPFRLEHEVCLDNDVAAALAEARNALDVASAKFKARPGDKELLSELEVCTRVYEDTRAEATDVLVVCEIKGMARPSFDRLKRRYKPTDDERKRVKESGVKDEIANAMEYSPWRFPPALVAECVVNPKMSAEDWLSIWGMRVEGDGVVDLTEDEMGPDHPARRWNTAETDQLFMTCMAACQRRAYLPEDALGKAPSTIQSPTPSSV